MTEEIKKINQALNLAVAEQVERSAHDWLVAAKGTDWTEKFESMMRENNRLRAELAATVKSHYDMANELVTVKKERDNWKECAEIHIRMAGDLSAKLTASELARSKAVEALRHIRKSCQCDRSTTGFDYGDSHPNLGKHPRVGARWTTPSETVDAVLAVQPANEVLETLREVEHRLAEHVRTGWAGIKEHDAEALTKLRSLIGDKP